MQIKNMKKGDFVQLTIKDNDGNSTTYLATIMEIGIEIDATKLPQSVVFTGVSSVTLSLMPSSSLIAGGKRRLEAFNADVAETDYPELSPYIWKENDNAASKQTN